MKNNAIKTSNKISNNNSNSQSTYTGNTKSGTNRNESEESLMNKFSGTNDISQHEDCLTNSCSRFNKLTNFSSPSSEQNLPTTENDVKAEISTSFTMEANPNSSKIPSGENDKELSLISSQITTERRPRNESIRQLSKRFRSFSIDVMRQIELAHDWVDLRNSNFVAATQIAAQQNYELRSTDRSDYDPEYGADLSDDNTYLSTLHKTRKDNTTKTSEHVQDVNDSRAAENLPSTSTTVNIQSENESMMLNVKNNPLLALNASNSTTYLSAGSLNTNNTISGEKPWSKRSKTNIIRQPEPTQRLEESLDQKKDAVSSNLNKNDQVDYQIKKGNRKKGIPDDIHISILEVFIYLWGLISFFADFITDIILAIEYYDNEKAWLGSMTLIFVIVPNLTLSLFSLSWYIDKYYSTKPKPNPDDPEKPQSSFSCESVTFWIMTVFFVVFQLDLVWKYIQGFVYTVKGWACRSVYKNLQWEKYYIEKQIKCDTDIGMLRLIDVFMDSAPQVLLQLYVITTQNLEKSGSGSVIVFTFKDTQTTALELKQFISIVSSLFSMGYALAGYHRCLRNQQFIFCLEQNKTLPRPMSWFATFTQFAWYLFLIAPRVLSMALFASTFRSWFFIIIFVHWLFMFFWILRLKTNYCITSQEVYSAREEIFEKFYDFVCSFIYIFCYFNLKSGPTRLRYLIYYIIFYSENLLFCVCYFLFSKEINYTYKISMLFIVVFGFWVAITFQLIYYLHCHPSHDIRVCVTKKNKEFHFIHKKTLRRPSTTHVSTSDDDSDVDDNLKNRIKKFGKIKFGKDEEASSLGQHKRTPAQTKPDNQTELIAKSMGELDAIEQHKDHSPSTLYLDESFDRIELSDISLDLNRTLKDSICKKRTSTSLKTVDKFLFEEHLEKRQSFRSYSLNTFSMISFDFETIPSNSGSPPVANTNEVVV